MLLRQGPTNRQSHVCASWHPRGCREQQQPPLQHPLLQLHELPEGIARSGTSRLRSRSEPPGDTRPQPSDESKSPCARPRTRRPALPPVAANRVRHRPVYYKRTERSRSRIREGAFSPCSAAKSAVKRSSTLIPSGLHSATYTHTHTPTPLQ